jgi:predicted transcriptional regulator
MIEHTMDVTDAEMKAALEACAPRIVHHTVAELVKEGYFTTEAVAKARTMKPASAKNFCQNMYESGAWERQLARREAGRDCFVYRPKRGGES